MQKAGMLLLAVTVAAAMTTTLFNMSGAEAATKAQQCWNTHKSCISRCKRVFETPDRIDACFRRCDGDVLGCIPNRSESSGMVQTDGPKGRPVKPGTVMPRGPSGGILDTSQGGAMPQQAPGGIGKPAGQ